MKRKTPPLEELVNAQRVMLGEVRDSLLQHESTLRQIAVEIRLSCSVMRRVSYQLLGIETAIHSVATALQPRPQPSFYKRMKFRILTWRYRLWKWYREKKYRAAVQKAAGVAGHDSGPWKVDPWA